MQPLCRPKPYHQGSKLANEARIGWALCYDNNDPDVKSCVRGNSKELIEKHAPYGTCLSTAHVAGSKSISDAIFRM